MLDIRNKLLPLAAYASEVMSGAVVIPTGTTKVTVWVNCEQWSSADDVLSVYLELSDDGVEWIGGGAYRNITCAQHRLPNGDLLRESPITVKHSFKIGALVRVRILPMKGAPITSVDLEFSA